MKKKIVVFVQLLILSAVLFAGYYVITHPFYASDTIHSLSYTAPVDVNQLAQDSAMTEEGRRLFFRYSPRIVPQQEVADACPGASRPIGCAVEQEILLAQTSDRQELIDTAEHEMLHAAYIRFSDETITELRPKLDLALQQTRSNAIRNEIQLYKDEPLDRYYDELHAIIGSLEPNIPENLRGHFGQFLEI